MEGPGWWSSTGAPWPCRERAFPPHSPPSVACQVSWLPEPMWKLVGTQALGIQSMEWSLCRKQSGHMWRVGLKVSKVSASKPKLLFPVSSASTVPSRSPSSSSCSSSSLGLQLLSYGWESSFHWVHKTFFSSAVDSASWVLTGGEGRSQYKATIHLPPGLPSS